MTIEDDLQNWARWVRVRPVQGHCASIEHRFRFRTSPDVDWREAPPVVPLSPIDVLSAIDVEKVMRLVPKGHRAALKLHYVLRMPYKLACKRLHLGYDVWERYIDDARLMVENLLRRSDKRRTINRRSLESAQAEGANPP